MATLKLYLDTRAAKADGKYPLKLALTHKTRTAYYNVGISLKPEQWNTLTQKVVAHPQRESYNRHIANRYAAFDNEMMKLVDSGTARNMSATEMKNHIVKVLDGGELQPEGLFIVAFEQRLSLMAEGRNKELYQHTLDTIRDFSSNKHLNFDDIDEDWLTAYNIWREKKAPSQNARNIDLRNIRAVFNYARKRKMTTLYPFLDYKIKSTETRKRSLKLSVFQEFINWQATPAQQRYLDYFRLIFYLIGINLKDLANLKASDYVDGRIHYIRAKGKRPYDIKVEPEAAALIAKYRAKVKPEYLVDIMDTRDNYKSFGDTMNYHLQRIGNWEQLNGKTKAIVTALHEDITSYWARHSWATIARNDCNISRDDIRLSLGHGEKTVTDIYINEDLGRVDAANRKVIDRVLNIGEYAEI